LRMLELCHGHVRFAKVRLLWRASWHRHGSGQHPLRDNTVLYMGLGDKWSV
jgi:hypothetical protein